MATQSSPANGAQAGPQRWAGEMRYVARQPILNLRGHVVAYDLLFRHSPEAVLNPARPKGREKAVGRRADMAARTMLDNAVIFGLEWLTNGLSAFVKCTVESLTEDLVLVLDPQATVLAIPAHLALTPKLLDCCRKLRGRGFRLALDDFGWQPELRPLAQLADFIRVDFNCFGAEERLYLRSLDCASPAMVARKVDTQQDYKNAGSEGFTLFQGGYFCNPILLKKRKVPANRLLHFEIVRLLHHDPIDVRQISQLVHRDASLTFRLLRLVNSPMYAIHQEVRSVEAAIIAVGETTFRRIVSLAVLSELNGEEPPELLHMALVRARFCEGTAPNCGLDSAEQYLLGMLSMVPAMLHLPIEEITPFLPLRGAICEALQGTLNPERSMLTWLECHERGDWETCDVIVQTHALSRDQVMECYSDSVIWAAASLWAPA